MFGAGRPSFVSALTMIRSFQARVRRVSPVLALAGSFAACGGGDGGTAPNIPPTTGALVVQISGLPTSLTPSFVLTAADGSTRQLTVGDTARNIPAGAATIRPGMPSAPGIGRWVPFQESYPVTIVAGSSVSETVQYAAAQIIVLAAATGLPTTAIPTLRLTAPDGSVFQTTAGAPFVTSAAGTWSVRGLPVSASDYLWTATGAAETRTVLPGDTATMNIAYAVASGAISVSAPGLDSTLRPVFTIAQGGISFSRQGPGVFADLPPGPWEVTATGISVPGLRWNPGSTRQSVNVTIGATNDVQVPYTATTIVSNLVLEGAYLTQAVQRPDGSVPLVAGRDALLRVFMTATDINTWRPPVRVSLFEGTNLLETYDIPAQVAGVDREVSEGNLQRSWNVRVNGHRIVPGLRMLVEADPDRTLVGDADLSDNIWPRNGTPQALTVTTVGTWHAVLVPVVNTSSNLTGDVTEANKGQFTNLVQRVLPIADANVVVRQPFTSSISALQSSDANRAWIALLSEMNALQAIERTVGRNEYFYGVVKVDYTSGIAGYGYVPGRAAVGWDYLPSGDGVAAHEWGHNFGRRHAPCGNVAGADLSFPTPGGFIGNWGWNPATNLLVSPNATDLMGYCGNQWISAHNWSASLSHRASTPNAIALSAAPTAANTDALLVWGTMSGNGRITLEPSFLISDGASGDESLADADMLLRVEALDANGQVLASRIVPAPRADHDAEGSRAFAAMLPLTASQHEQLATVRAFDVRAPIGGATRRRDRVAAAVDAARPLGDALRATRIGNTRSRVSWNDARVVGALVRDANTRRVLSIMRSGGGEVTGARGDLEVVLSDGVRSRIARITAP